MDSNECAICGYIAKSSPGLSRHVSACEKKPSREKLELLVRENTSLTDIAAGYKVSIEIVKKWLADIGHGDYRAGCGLHQGVPLSKDELVKLVEAKRTNRYIADRYGVSRETVRLWKIKYELVRSRAKIEKVKVGRFNSWGNNVVEFLDRPVDVVCRDIRKYGRGTL